MAFGSLDRGHSTGPMAEINMVPLIDVMLVLLVIFIVTAPLLTHAVKLELPQVSSQPVAPAPEKIVLSIDAQGQRYWNGEALERDATAARFALAGQEVAQGAAQPEIRLHADQAVPYRFVAQTLADAAKAGLTRIGFVSQPE